MTVTMVLAAVLLILLISVEIASAQLNIVATTFPADNGNNPNTFVATSNQIGSSLLGHGVASVLWVSVKSSDVTTVCKQIVSTGRLSFSVTVTDSIDGSQESVNVQIKATGGCEAAPDESGTEMVWVDNLGRSAALVCPQNAGSIGCGVFMTGDGITRFYNQYQGGGRRLLARPPSRDLISCDGDEFAVGYFLGFVTSFRNTMACLVLPPPANAYCALITTIGSGLVGGFLVGCVQYSARSSCFPGDATLQLPGGISKSMAELEVGDKVAVWRPDGTFGYEDIYAFGHRDAIATSRFYKISMSRQDEGLETSLELSGRHFAPISSPDTGGQKMVYLRAQDIRTGDMMWAVNDDGVALYNVTGISIKVKQGLYNPFTMTGTIFVNGVVSSVHSDWFLDKMFDMLGVTYMLPTAYQVALAPPRMLYKVMGKELYTIAYDWLDQHLNIVQHISDYSWIGASLVLTGAALGGPSLYYIKGISINRKT